MSVLIEGMEMPKSCAGCYMFLHGIDMDGTPWHECAVADRETDNLFGCGKPDWCPLVELPPHGRLIDTSEEILVQAYDDQYEDYHWVKMSIDDLFCQGWIEADVPTVVEE